MERAIDVLVRVDRACREVDELTAFGVAIRTLNHAFPRS
jgi:hypothetical protein